MLTRHAKAYSSSCLVV